MNELTPESNDPAQQDVTGGSYPLGAPIRIFRTSKRNRVILAVCGIVMLGAGIVMQIYVHGRGFFTITSLLGGGLIVLLVAFLLGNTTLLICPGGIQQIRRRKQERCRWDELREIVSLHEKNGIVTSRRCSLMRRDNTSIVLTDLAMGEYDALIAMLRRLAETHAIPWREEQITK